MRPARLLFVGFLMMSFYSVFAQSEETVTDDELRKYAVAMDSIDGMRKDLVESISEMVKNNGKITAARYNELSKIIADETKLAEAKATPEEIEAIREILKAKDEGTTKINETFQSLAKEYVGATTYNKVRKALSTDTELKTKYEALMAELKKEDTE